jgi:RNA polymerase sigma-70 factor (ECF subfamily)
MANRQEFEELALPHLDTVYRVALSLCRDPATADDLAQTTFLKAWRSFDSYRRGTNIKAWLLRILRNRWIDVLRHRKVVGPTAAVEEQLVSDRQHATETEWNDAEDLLQNFGDEQIIEAMQELPEEQRLTLFLLDVEGLSQEEVAEITDVAVGTVKSRSSRARRMMKERLTEHARDLGFLQRTGPDQ